MVKIHIAKAMCSVSLKRHADRQTKMDADEESRSRQYGGTAMSDDEVSKVHKIQAFGTFAKSYTKDKNLQSKFLVITLIIGFVCTLRCVLFRQSDT